MPPIRVLHVITGLHTGGAEMMLNRLVSTLPRDEFESHVLSLTAGGPIADRLRASGIPVTSLGLTRAPSPAALWQCVRHVRDVQPQIVQGWMVHGNLAATLLARTAGSRPALVWNVRQALYDLAYESPVTRQLIRFGARLSTLPAHIIYNSARAAAQHQDIGYARGKTLVIPNGFDVARFRPDPAAEAAVRAELGVPREAPLVGIVGRFHPMKDHGTFLAAAGDLVKDGSPAHFLLAGSGMTPSNTTLADTIQRHGLTDRVHLLGERSDTERLYAAMDVSVLSSYTEAFPNVVGEAMACGTPCVSTDVGDAREIVADSGVIVPIRNPAALTSGMASLLALSDSDRRALGARARARIAESWSIDRIAARYADLYRSSASL